MIQRLNQSPVSFGTKKSVSAREAYDALMVQNSQTAQKQNNMVAKMANQIPMQGQGVGQKLDVVV